MYLFWTRFFRAATMRLIHYVAISVFSHHFESMQKLRKITNIFICSNCPDSSLEIRYRNWGANQTTRWKTAVARLPFRMLFHAYHRLISLINRRINSATHLLKQVWLATDGRNCKNNVRTATTRKRGQTSVCLQIKSATPNESNELLAL